MAFIVTQGELEYQAAQVLTGKTYEVFLANKGSLTLTSTLTQWESAKLSSGNGYASVTGTVGSGSYNSTNDRFEAPVISGQFTATGAGYTFDAMVVKLQGRTKPYAINIYDTPVTLAAGQARGFTITLGIRP